MNQDDALRYFTAGGDWNIIGPLKDKASRQCVINQPPGQATSECLFNQPHQPGPEEVLPQPPVVE